jgi:hypothetical protein
VVQSDDIRWPVARTGIGTNSFHRLTTSEGSDVAEACLQASYQLRRSVHRQMETTEASRAVSLATCHLLDAVSRALNDDPHCLPPSVAAAALRLSERIAEPPPTPHPTPRTRSVEAPG